MLKLLKDDNSLYETAFEHTKVYIKPEDLNLSRRKVESLKKIAVMQQYYQRNPVRFISDFFGIELLDFQALIVQAAWVCPNVCILETRSGGKSLVAGLTMMAKGMLFSNSWWYIASGSGAQAQNTFMTLEKLANDNIDEMIGSTGYIFKNEVIVPNANGDGFSHSSDGFRFELYNGSFTQTLNSNIDKKRGKNSNRTDTETLRLPHFIEI